MHDGWEYVVAAYGVTAVTLGAWFAVILRKLARQRRSMSTPAPDVSTRQERTDG